MKNKLTKLETQVRTYSHQTSSFTDNTVKVRQLELDKIHLTQKAQVFEEQARNFETENQNLLLQHRNLQKNFEEVNTLYVNLLQGGEGKVQHINKIKSQSNQANQQVTQLAIEINQHKKQIEKLTGQVRELHAIISDFGDQIVVRIMRLNKSFVFKSCGALKPDCANIKEFLTTIQEVVQQGCTNQNLQLNTPINGFSQQVPKVYSI